MNDIISLEDHLSSSGKYPDRMSDPECTDEVKNNAKKLLVQVNQLLNDLGITNCKVSSGFRTQAANAAIPTAAKKSLHMIGLAIDIEDKDGSLDKLIENNDDLLKKYGLWQELPAKTIGWIHLDIKDRGKRDKNQFIP